TNDKRLKAINYEILGDYFFDYTEYKIAGAYYDSTMLNMKKDTKPYRIMKRKRDNLDDVIYYEDIAFANDSIISLTTLSKDEQLAFFQDYTEKLKVKAQEELERKELEQEAANRNQDFASMDNNKNGFASRDSSKSLSRGPNTPPGSSFYFYNPTTVAYGKNDFLKKWGDRPLEDNWRWSTKSKANINVSAKDAKSAVLAENELFKPEYYISQIPTDQKAIDSIVKERNFAYYQLAVIYKEKFKEYELSKERFLDLLSMEPEQKLVLPSKYNLYKIYTLLGENDEAQITKNDIISNYPDSRYAAILKNPESLAAKDENSPESIYQSLYSKLE
ncbi:MAG: hypothetical protein KDD23_00725, partial [Winogradskyella sp.]|nr:hypothetical protein [Winogradskyella sp.]